ncbi:MAG: hypothetical protein Q4E16_03350 [Neisseria sp.]|nr:hypothetical protein [Neisseria sp.]
MQNQNKIGTGKTIMLAMPDVVGLSDMIIKNLEYHGFTVINGTYRPFHYRYKNIWERVYKFLRHVFLRERNYKSRRQAEIFLGDKIIPQFEKQGLILGKDKIDYILFIHASIFPHSVLDKICELAYQSVAYHWDGFAIFPEILEYIPKFERFFAFDIDDIKNNPQWNLLSTTNFYFDLDDDEVAMLPAYNTNNPSVYFVGRHWLNRTPMIDDFLGQISQFNITPKFYILDEKNEGYQEYKNADKINFLSQSMPFEQNLEQVKHSDILVDFVKAEHNGLSFRFFESIHYNKKLITNNVKVKDYDLYHESNVFVWENGEIDVQAFEHFLTTPFVPIEQHIKEKYSFGNWIKYILDIQPHVSLSLLK